MTSLEKYYFCKFYICFLFQDSILIMTRSWWMILCPFWKMKYQIKKIKMWTFSASHLKYVSNSMASIFFQWQVVSYSSIKYNVTIHNNTTQDFSLSTRQHNACFYSLNESTIAEHNKENLNKYQQLKVDSSLKLFLSRVCFEEPNFAYYFLTELSIWLYHGKSRNLSKIPQV